MGHSGRTCSLVGECLGVPRLVEVAGEIPDELLACGPVLHGEPPHRALRVCEPRGHLACCHLPHPGRVEVACGLQAKKFVHLYGHIKPAEVFLPSINIIINITTRHLDGVANEGRDGERTVPPVVHLRQFGELRQCDFVRDVCQRRGTGRGTGRSTASIVHMLALVCADVRAILAMHRHEARCCQQYNEQALHDGGRFKSLAPREVHRRGARCAASLRHLCLRLHLFSFCAALLLTSMQLLCGFCTASLRRLLYLCAASAVRRCWQSLGVPCSP